MRYCECARNKYISSLFSSLIGALRVCLVQIWVMRNIGSGELRCRRRRDLLAMDGLALREYFSGSSSESSACTPYLLKNYVTPSECNPRGRWNAPRLFEGRVGTYNAHIDAYPLRQELVEHSWKQGCNASLSLRWKRGHQFCYRQRDPEHSFAVPMVAHTAGLY